jgi:hypothetical protein
MDVDDMSTEIECVNTMTIRKNVYALIPVEKRSAVAEMEADLIKVNMSTEIEQNMRM